MGVAVYTDGSADIMYLNRPNHPKISHIPPEVVQQQHSKEEVNEQQQHFEGSRVSSAVQSHVGERCRSQLSVVFFDFDSTLSTPQFLHRAQDIAVSDRPKLCCSMTRQEILLNFGGHQRLNDLAAMLRKLSQNDVAMFIISLGFTEAIQKHLNALGLDSFFPKDRIFGQDSPRMHEVQHQKAVLIHRLLQENGWQKVRALFVDDSDKHIHLCDRLGVCQTLHVQGDGLCIEEMHAICAKTGR